MGLMPLGSWPLSGPPGPTCDRKAVWWSFGAPSSEISGRAVCLPAFSQALVGPGAVGANGSDPVSQGGGRGHGIRGSVLSPPTEIHRPICTGGEDPHTLGDSG